jgi:hypothetical protein
MKAAITLLAISSAGFAVEPCRIEIVDKENGWPVPLVELRTTHDARYVSDNAGLVALEDPELLGRAVWFHVKGHGYGVKQDGFGYEGVSVSPMARGKLRIEVERRNVAKRLGRLTGAGLFAEEQKLGGQERIPDGSIFGCDSVLVARHGEKLFWLWGDTTMPHYPLGIFQSTAAHTVAKPIPDFKPPLAIRFDHFRNETYHIKGVAPIPGDGPTWLTGMIEIPSETGGKRLVATYSKIKGHLDEYEIGLCAWDEAKESFIRHRVLWKDGDGEKGLIPRGHPFVWKDDQQKEWILFGDPFPAMRCPATFEAWQKKELWAKVTVPPSPRAADDGSEVKPHRGSVAWNPFRKRWVAIFTQTRGKPSPFGEIWYAEAGSPMGPWGKAVKVLTHDNYTFYNPRIHPELTPEDASFIVFEGTYTAEFANHAEKTPRYNYNQILYRLDLDDPKLAAARE